MPILAPTLLYSCDENVDDAGNIIAGATCTFQCGPRECLVGSDAMTCVNEGTAELPRGEWNHNEIPTCQRKYYFEDNQLDLSWISEIRDRRFRNSSDCYFQNMETLFDYPVDPCRSRRTWSRRDQLQPQGSSQAKCLPKHTGLAA